MNTYPYTNYQDANLDWILTVGAELRACFEPVEVSGPDSYKELVRRGALATIKFANIQYTGSNIPIILHIYRIDSVNQKLYFSSVFYHELFKKMVSLVITVDYNGNLSVITP